MGSFFTFIDDIKNERVFLYRADGPSEQCIWLETDPTGATELPMPAALSKVDMGTAKNAAGFIMPYKAGVKLAITTDLAATGTSGDDLTLVWAGGTAPYHVYVDVINLQERLDNVTQTAKAYTFDTQGHPVGQYVITVEDTHGVTVRSKTCTIS